MLTEPWRRSLSTGVVGATEVFVMLEISAGESGVDPLRPLSLLIVLESTTVTSAKTAKGKAVWFVQELEKAKLP